MAEKPDKQIEAIKLQQTWSIWLVTAQLAIFAAVVSSDRFKQLERHPSSSIRHTLLVIAMCSSWLSIIAASILASAHPSMMLRAKESWNDLNVQLWDFKGCPKALPIAIAEHYAFILSIVCYGLVFF